MIFGWMRQFAVRRKAAIVNQFLYRAGSDFLMKPVVKLCSPIGRDLG
jgi:hypothetical protein